MDAKNLFTEKGLQENASYQICEVICFPKDTMRYKYLWLSLGHTINYLAKVQFTFCKQKIGHFYQFFWSFVFNAHFLFYVIFFFSRMSVLCSFQWIQDKFTRMISSPTATSKTQGIRYKVCLLLIVFSFSQPQIRYSQ